MIKSKKDLGIWLLFLGLSIFFAIFLLFSHAIGLAADGSFHFSRAEEIYQNLKAGHFFTFIATHTFHNSGVGSFLFYPTVFLYPWAFLRFFLDSITAFYVWYGFIMFLTLAIAYYSMYSFSKNKLRAVIFAVFYTIAVYHIYLGVKSYVLGEFIAYTFVPLALYGFYEVIWGDQKKWYVLGIGVALLTYSHIISVVLAVGLMSILLICKLAVTSHISKERLKALLKSIGLAIILTLWYFLPFLTDFVHGNLGVPGFGFSFLYSVQDLWSASLENYATNRGIGIVLIATALCGWYFAKHDKRELCLYVMGILFIALSTNLFPYSELLRIDKLKFLGVFQFPYRFSTYSTLFMAATLSLGIEKGIRHFKNSSVRNSIIFLVISSALVLYIQTLTPVLDRVYDAKPTAYLTKSDNTLTALPVDAIIDKHNYYNIYTYRVLYGETDYYPKASFSGNDIDNNIRAQSIMLHQATINGKTITVHPKPKPNTIEYSLKLKENSTVDLPVVAYQSDKVYVNGKLVKHTISERGTIKIHLDQGKNKIVIRYEVNKVYYILFIVAVLSWIVLFVKSIRKHTLHSEK